jgi:hypothetical protein
MAGEKGRDWLSVALGLVIVGIVSALLWSWVDGIPSTSVLGNGIGPLWIVALSAAAILLLLLITRLLRPRR